LNYIEADKSNLAELARSFLGKNGLVNI